MFYDELRPGEISRWSRVRATASVAGGTRVPWRRRHRGRAGVAVMIVEPLDQIKVLFTSTSVKLAPIARTASAE